MTELKAKPRTELGKKTNALRRAGFLPAVVYPVRNSPPKGPSGAQSAGEISNGVYGEETTSQPIKVLYKDFEKAYKKVGESTLLKLDVDGKAYNVLIHDIKNDPLKGTPLHADFYAVRMDKEIRIKVPIEFFGESPAVKNDGGILVKVMQEIEIEALPQDLPHGLRANLPSLETFESKIFVKNILLPKGVKSLAGPDEIIALVEPPRSEEELASLAQAPVAEAQVEVKTEQELKREAKGEEKAEETKEGAGKPEGKKL